MVAPMNSHNKGLFLSTSPTITENVEHTNPNRQKGQAMFHFAEIAERVDWITQCHSPAEIFSYFSKDEEDGDDGIHRQYQAEEQQEPICPYPLPSSCEYCGAGSTKDCPPLNCKRPKSFFVKQRPPFCPRDRETWDLNTDTFKPSILLNGDEQFRGSSPEKCNDDLSKREMVAHRNPYHNKKKDFMTIVEWKG